MSSELSDEGDKDSRRRGRSRGSVEGSHRHMAGCAGSDVRSINDELIGGSPRPYKKCPTALYLRLRPKFGHGTAETLA